MEDKEVPDGADDSSGDETASEVEPLQVKRKRDSLERHKRFERNMNRCNSLQTKVARLIDHHCSLRKTKRVPVISNNPEMLVEVPVFNPTVPPPNYIDVR